MREPRAEPAPRPVVAELLARLVTRRSYWVGVARRYTGSVAAAEDLLQSAFERAAAKLSSLQQPAALDAWFARLLRHAAFDERDAQTLRQRGLEALAHETSAPAPDTDSLCACSLGLLARLPAAQSALLTRVDIEEHALAEVAHTLGISAGTARVRLHRARRALREALQSTCGTRSLRECVGCAC